MPRTGRPVIAIELEEEERDFLEHLSRKRSAPAAEVKRARAILKMADGASNQVAAEAAGLCRHTAGTLRRRFAELRLAGLSDLPRSGAPRKISDADIHELVEKTLQSVPEGATHWSTRKMAQKWGYSRESVGRIWRTFGLKPHRTETFQISRDPHYVEKVHDVVGLYMSPPENALVLSVDEKSQIQALQRSQPVLPLRPSKPEAHTPEYFRHGTTTLFAALNVKSGEVLGSCYQRHRAKEFLAFLKEIEEHIEEDVTDGKSVHLILDNYATHKAVTITRWLAKRPHWHLHFTPTHASWLNQVERFFGKITSEAIRRGNFHCVADLKAAITNYISVHNRSPKPFRWTKSAETILNKTAKLCKGLA